MDKREVIKILKKYSEEVIKTFKPTRIVLYGSYAKGNWKEESDIDIAIVMPKIDGDFLEMEQMLYKLRRNICDNIEPMIFIEGNDKSGFLKNIMSYGEIIYSA